MKSLEEIKMTKLDECYLVIYMIKSKVNMKHEKCIETKNMYTIIGLSTQGKRKYIASYIDNQNDHRYWLDIFERLKAKGIKDMIFLVVDDNTYLKKCAKISYPNIEIIPSLLEISDEFFKYFSDKFSSKIRTEIKQLYLQESEEQYRNNYSLFIEKYGHNSILVSLINKYLKNIESVYKYDKPIRVVLFNTYFLRVIKNAINKINKYNQYYNDVDDIMGSLTEQLNNVENYKSYTKKEWLNILEAFYKIYGNRIEVYL